MAEEKDNPSVVVIGHSDCGKSTIAGQLIYIYRELYKNKSYRVELEKTSEEMGKKSHKWAYVLDTSKEERERGITINAHHDFLNCWSDGNKILYIIDVPGNRDYIQNVIPAVSNADCALLVVSATAGEFEAGMAKNGQTREHVLLASSLGVTQMIVAVNKMDTTKPAYSEKRFEEVKKVVYDYVKTMGFNPKAIPVIPISGLHGQNLDQCSSKIPWYGGWISERRNRRVSGITLGEAFDVIYVNRGLVKPLRITLRGTKMDLDYGELFHGRVEAGHLKLGMVVNFSPINITSKVKTIWRRNDKVEEAFRGDNIRFCVFEEQKCEVTGGMVVSDSNNNPAKKVKSFLATVSIIANHPVEMNVGYQSVLFCHNVHVTCTFQELRQKIDIRTRRVLEENPKMVKTGDGALIKIVPSHPICVEAFSKCPAIGRFVVFDGKQVVALGMINSVEDDTGADECIEKKQN